MRTGIRIGKILGIDIRVDWSWLFIFLLVTWNLASVFGQTHQEWKSTLNWGLAVIAALLFFTSVLVHELAHSLVARAQGVPVRNITLFLFGGVSNIQKEPESPGNEFRMAIVGPLTSIVLGGILVVISSIAFAPLSTTISDPTQAIAQVSPLAFILAWLGYINMLLGIFNLIPGFPLDGGRILRSIFWATTQSLRRATRWASWVGQAIAWLMIVTGVAMTFGANIPFFGTGLLSGLWLAFIGWFLNSASAQSYQQLVVHDILEGVAVERIMRMDPPTVSPNVSVGSLVHDHVMQADDYGFPVIEGAHLAGIVTLEDVRKVPREAWDMTIVREIMTPAERLVITTPQEDAAEALRKMTERDVRQLPVLRDGHLAGLLRRQEITRWLQLHAELMSR